MNSSSPLVICWSGGFDSTLLLLDTLNRLKNNNDETTVQCITVVSDRIGDSKVKREKVARENIKKYIKDNFKNIEIQYREISLHTDDDRDFTEGDIVFGQPLLWAMTVIPFLDENAKLLFGYILDDHLTTFKFYKPFIEMINAASELCQKNLTFDFPFITCSKEDIINELIKSYPGVIDYLTCCESLSDEDNCGKCKPCSTLIKSLINLSAVNTDSINEANNILEKRFGLSVTVNKLDNCKFNEESQKSGEVID